MAPVVTVRVHLQGGYAVVDARYDRQPRAVLPQDTAFLTVVTALQWALAHRPSHEFDVHPECEVEELAYRAEVAQFATMLNAARAWCDEHAERLDDRATRELTAILFPTTSTRSLTVYHVCKRRLLVL